MIRLIPKKNSMIVIQDHARDDGVVYQSIREASRENGVHESKVGAVCRGERKRTAGHSFRFLTKEEAEKALEEMEK